MLTVDRLWKSVWKSVWKPVWKLVWKLVSRLTIVLGLWLTLHCTNGVLAEQLALDTNPSEQQSSPGGVDSSNIPSEKVSQFVNACLQVVALIDRREGSLQGAETESESLRIEQEIESEALAIIQQAGLTRQEYVQLLGLANTDPEFGERVAVQLQEATS